MRILSQSSSLFGSTSTTPCLVTVVPTALKMLSATGSIMYFINSLTDTTGFRSPHSAAAGGGSAVYAGVGVGLDDEHAAIVALRTISPAHMARP